MKPILYLSVAALLIPDTKSEEDCFPLDRRPMLRLRQYAYLAQEVSLDDNLMAVCRDAWRVKFENVVVPFVRDAKLANEIAMKSNGNVDDALNDAVMQGVLTNRARSVAELADDEYDGLLDAVENTASNIYCDKPGLGMNLTHEYDDVMSKVPAGWALRFLKRQAYLSYINAHRDAFTAPSEDGDWMTTLIASGWHPAAVDFECGCTTDAPASEDSASVSDEDVPLDDTDGDVVCDFDEESAGQE